MLYRSCVVGKLTRVELPELRERPGHGGYSVLVLEVVIPFFDVAMP